MAEDIVDAHTVDKQMIDEGLYGFTWTSCLKNTCHADASRLSRKLQKERPPGRRSGLVWRGTSGRKTPSHMVFLEILPETCSVADCSETC